MIKYVLIPFIAMLFITSCKTPKHDDPVPDYSNSYLPLKTGNTWTYIHNGHITDTIVSKVTSDSYLQDLQTFYGVESSVSGEIYYSQNHNIYSMVVSPDFGTNFSTPILDENKSEGYTVTTKDSIANSNNTTPPRAIFTMIENNFGKTINGKIYDNVIHTNIDVQEAFNGNYMSVEIYDLYFARGIGLIEIDKSNGGFIYDTLTIVSYKVR